MPEKSVTVPAHKERLTNPAKSQSMTSISEAAARAALEGFEAPKDIGGNIRGAGFWCWVSVFPKALRSQYDVH